MLEAFRDAAFGAALDWPSRDQALAQMTTLTRAAEDDPIERLPGELVMQGRVFATSVASSTATARASTSRATCCRR